MVGLLPDMGRSETGIFKLISGLVVATILAVAAPASAASLDRSSQITTAADGRSEQRGVEASPFVIKVIPAEKSKDEIVREQKEKTEASLVEKRLADLTGDLAFYTEGLFGATAVLAALTAGLLILGIVQSKDAKKSIAVSEIAAKAARDQVKLGRDEYVASFRPKLSVRHVALGTPDSPFPTNPGMGDKIIGSLIVVNNGGTKATVVDSRYLIYFSHQADLPMHSPLEEKWAELIPPDKVFEVAESCSIPIEGVASVTHPRGSFIELRKNYATVYVMGQIQYRDEAGNERFIGFCRKWCGEGTFTAVSEPDYEYAE